MPWRKQPDYAASVAKSLAPPRERPAHPALRARQDVPVAGSVTRYCRGFRLARDLRSLDAMTNTIQVSLSRTAAAISSALGQTSPGATMFAGLLAGFDTAPAAAAGSPLATGTSAASAPQQILLGSTVLATARTSLPDATLAFAQPVSILPPWSIARSSSVTAGLGPAASGVAPPAKASAASAQPIVNPGPSLGTVTMPVLTPAMSAVAVTAVPSAVGGPADPMDLASGAELAAGPLATQPIAVPTPKSFPGAAKTSLPTPSQAQTTAAVIIPQPTIGTATAAPPANSAAETRAAPNSGGTTPQAPAALVASPPQPTIATAVAFPLANAGSRRHSPTQRGTGRIGRGDCAATGQLGSGSHHPAECRTDEAGRSAAGAGHPCGNTAHTVRGHPCRGGFNGAHRGETEPGPAAPVANCCGNRAQPRDFSHRHGCRAGSTGRGHRARTRRTAQAGHVQDATQRHSPHHGRYAVARNDQRCPGCIRSCRRPERPGRSDRCTIPAHNRKS